MALTPGSRIGPYEITGHLGAGGMGEVYRARDVALDRDVAIKVLPESFAADADRVARITREARVLAALSHPHIAGIYGIEHAGETPALVMEFVPGEDLSQVLERGALPVEEALTIARQVAEALEAAHAAGVIHRDLKPANIKVRSDGTVKVLDFGLAKVADSAAAPGNVANSPTLTARATQMGMILGTAAYMAPEQARGRAVDRRADIWALGCVLYEMLTGQRAFKGDDVSITLASVLKEDVDWTVLPPAITPALRRLLRRCLVKDPAARLRDAGDVRLEIDEILLSPTGEPEAPAPASSKTPGRPWAAIAALLIIVGALSAAAAWWLKPAGTPVPLRKFTIRAENGAGISGAVISPDGRSVAMLIGGTLHVRRLDALDTIEIPGASDVNKVFWSPDSSMLGFEARAQLWKVPAMGGTPEPIGRVPRGFTGAGGAAWVPGNRIVFTTGNSGLLEISALGGEPRPLLDYDPEGDTDFHEVSALPDGRGFLFIAHRPASVQRIDLFDGQERRPLLELGEDARVHYPVYSRSGHILFELDYASDALPANIWAVAYDLAGGQVTGEPFRIAPSGGEPSVSDDGSLAIGTSNSNLANMNLSWVDTRGEPVESFTPAIARLYRPQLSPDGRAVAGSRPNSAGQSDIWIVDLQQHTERRLTFEPGVHSHPTWSHDGRFIVHVCPDGICARPADGSGQVVVLAPTPASMPALSPDDDVLLFVKRVEGSGPDVYQVSLGAGGLSTAPTSSPVSLIASDRTERDPRVSPSGSWMAYSSNDTGPYTIYVAEFPSGKSARPVARGTNPIWSPAGDRLYFLDTGNAHFVDVTTTPAFTFSEPRASLAFRLGLGPLTDAFAPSAGGDRFLVNRSPVMAEAGTVTIIQNWFAEFAERIQSGR